MLYDCPLAFLPDFMPADEAWRCFHELEYSVCWRQDNIQMLGKKIPVPRLNAWYGDAAAHYAYSGISLKPKPWLPLLAALRDQVVNLAGVKFNSVLLNYYRNERDSVAWHSDNEPELGAKPVIASLSLGQAREFQLKPKKKGLGRQALQKLELTHGSLLIMGGGTQEHWKHCLPKQNRAMQPRINLTFRRIISNDGATVRAG